MPPYGPPQFGQPYGNAPHPYFPSGQGPQQPPQPPQGGGSTKWLLAAIAVLLVIGVTIGATLLLSGGDSGPSGSPSTTNQSDIASVNDTGPVSIVTEEPTCAAYISINDSIARAQTQGWGDLRESLGARESWTAQQQSTVAGVATAMKNASSQLASLAKQTPHRVVRELYEQYIAYSRAYSDSIPTYVPADNALATVAVTIGNTLAAICTSIDNGAASRSINVDPLDDPANANPPPDLSDPSRFITEPTTLCNQWLERESRNLVELADWAQLDTDLSIDQWSAEQRAVQDAAVPRLLRFAEETTAASRESVNPVIEDFGSLAGQYLRAYASASSTYVSADSWLSSAGLKLTNIVTEACRAATG